MQLLLFRQGFNTQPPEGGWKRLFLQPFCFVCFNTQPPEGGWDEKETAFPQDRVSTHSRPKAAGPTAIFCFKFFIVSTHSRPKAAGFTFIGRRYNNTQFQHTAARRRLDVHISLSKMNKRFNTQPPEGGWVCFRPRGFVRVVSTHSRPKAAGHSGFCPNLVRLCFNTQPPEGGWMGSKSKHEQLCVSTHSRPKAAGPYKENRRDVVQFQHTAARRRLEPLSKALLHQVSQPRFR